jgi:hypothetical protein
VSKKEVGRTSLIFRTILLTGITTRNGTLLELIY